MWLMVWFAADCAIVALVFMYSSVISYRDGWQSADYIFVLLPFFATSIFFSAVIWPKGWIPNDITSFIFGTANVICFAGIGVILTFTDVPVAWAVCLGMAGLFRPYNTAFISYFGFNDVDINVFAALCRLRTLFEHFGFIMASFVAFHAFHYADDGDLLVSIALCSMLIISILLAHQSANDPRFGFYRPPTKQTTVEEGAVSAALRSVMVQLFIVEAIRYSLISYGFVVLLTRVQYVPVMLPAALSVNGFLYFFASTTFMSNVIYNKYRAVALATGASLIAFIGQLIIDFSANADSGYIFIPYTISFVGLSLISHLPLMRMYSVTTQAKITSVSFASSELSIIHLGAAVGCVLTLAIYKWFACPPYSLYVALLLYLQRSEERIGNDIQGLSVISGI